ncbi:MAG: trypsin-like peptidase domain-containing protein [Bacteroidota bacterium]
MSQGKFQIWRPFMWGAILVLGFFLGTAWKNQETTSQIQDQQQAVTEETNKKVAVPLSTNLGANTNTNTPPNTTPSMALNPQELATINLFERAAPSVAFITTTNVRRDYWTRDITEIPRGTGSAFIWDASGHIITNYHVIQGADKAQVTLADQSTWPASLVGAAPEKDLAVLKIEVEDKTLQPIPVAPTDDLRVGQSVYAIGNPFGLDQTLTTGIISALGREIESVNKVPIRDVIQTDAAINPGNSGGPLLDSSGRLIGVNTAIYSPSGAYAGIGFSIPADVVSWVVPDLINYGKIKRPSLGVEIASSQVMSRLAMKGVLVLEVVQGSAAEKSGIIPTRRDRRGSFLLGDIIVGINEDSIDSRGDLILALEKYKPGDQIRLKLLRDYEPFELDLTLDQAR